MINKQEFLKGILSILLVIFIVSIFELIFYYRIVAPNIIEKLKNLSNLSILEPIPFSKTLKGLAVGEKEKNDYTNSLKAGIMSIVIVIIFLLIIWSYLSLRRNTEKQHHKSDTLFIIFNSFIIIILLIAFQAFMYIFGNKYNYASKDELEIRFINEILKDQGRDNEVIPLPSGTSFSKSNT